jgi:hypothetical protein
MPREGRRPTELDVVWGLRRGNRCGVVGNADLARFLDDFERRVVVETEEFVWEKVMLEEIFLVTVIRLYLALVGVTWWDMALRTVG